MLAQLAMPASARAAIKAFAEYEIDKEVRAAANRQARDPYKYEYYPGEQVAFMKRKSTKGQRRKP